MRWATVIEKVLKIRKAPTNSEMPANASRNVFRNPRLSWMSLDSLSACSWPVRTSTVGPSVRAQLGLELLGRHAGLGGDLDLVEAVALAEHPLGLGQHEVEHRRAAERAQAGDLRRPDERVALARRGGDGADLVADLPPLLVGRRGVDRRLVGVLRPAARLEREALEARHVGDRGRGSSGPRRCRCACRPCRGSCRRRRSSPRRSPRPAAGAPCPAPVRGPVGAVPPLLVVSIVLCGVMATSVPRLETVKIVSKALLIESVKT